MRFRWLAPVAPGTQRSGRLTGVQARSALFDLYGDHLRARGGQAPVAALVRLLAPLGITAPAVRTAVSRMVRQDWLVPVRLPSGPGYRLTERATRRLDEAHARIYRTTAPDRAASHHSESSHHPESQWDGRWHLVVVDPPKQRAARERLRDQLSFLGYGVLGDGIWVAPRGSVELTTLLEAELRWTATFTAVQEGDGVALARRAWDLDAIARDYHRWILQARTLLAGSDASSTTDTTGDDDASRDDDLARDDEAAFATRFALVHEWRKFLFRDPVLPEALLPPDWPGHQAASLFDDAAQRLRPAADRFVDRCLRPDSLTLAGSGHGRTRPEQARHN